MLYNRILCLFQNAANLGPASDFYKKLALDCSAQQVAVDLFLLNGQFADIATVCKSAELMRLNQCGWIREMTVSLHWVYVCVRHHTHHWISVSGLGKWVSLHVSLCVCQAPCTPLNHCEWIREMTVSLHASLLCVSGTLLNQFEWIRKVTVSVHVGLCMHQVLCMPSTLLPE